MTIEVKRLFKTVDQVPYAEVVTGQKSQIVPVHSTEMQHLIIQTIYEKGGKPPTKSIIEEVQSHYAAKAIFHGQQEDVFIRIAGMADKLEVDLNNPEGSCVLINNRGWEIAQPTANFFRPSSSKELIVPQMGGDWALFEKHFHTKTEDDLRLIIGFIVSCYRSQGPYPVLVLQGEQGSAKSTTTQMIKALVDPAKGATRGLIKKEHDIFIAAKNNHLLSFDNVSLIKNDLSDILCRLATGGSFSTRTLYTNDGETLIELCKPVLLNGISDFVTRADLISRSIVIELAPITEKQRKDENKVWSDFYADLPLMLGVIMDAVSSAIRYKDRVFIEKLPRMADVAKWCTAAEEGLLWKQGTFMRAYEANQSNSIITALSNEPVAIALRSFMTALLKASWTGTATQLLSELSLNHRPYMDSSRSWPNSAAYLSECLTRLAPSLRKVGLDIRKDRVSDKRYVTVEKLCNFIESEQDENPRASHFDHEYLFDGYYDADDAHDAVRD